MAEDDPNKYKITVSDIVKGIISIVVCGAVATLLYGLAMNGVLLVNNYILENYSRLTWIFFFVFILTVYGFVVGISKAIEGGFSPWGLLRKFKKREESPEVKNKK